MRNTVACSLYPVIPTGAKRSGGTPVFVLAVACSCRHSERVFRARRTPMNSAPPQPPDPFSRKTPPIAWCPILRFFLAKGGSTSNSARSRIFFREFPRNSPCQAPRRQKIPLTPTPSTTCPRKIVGIVVMLHLLQLIHGSNPSSFGQHRAVILAQPQESSF
jgi:hypothetical protein